jgi:glycosyltransferase involved in cell wall biosynthesis
VVMANRTSNRPVPPGVAIVVPVFNERECLPEFHDRVERLGHAGNLVFVDSASTDGSSDLIARMPGARLIRHDANRGYGASIRDGIAASNAGRIVIIDADLEYPPEAIPEILSALDAHPVVYGSRFLNGSPSGMPLFRRIGNRIVSALYNRLFHQQTTDFYTGMKGLRHDALEALHLRQDGFEHVVEMGAQLARAGIRIREIPVTYTPRSRGVSKMKHLPELLKYIWFVARYKITTQ